MEQPIDQHGEMPDLTPPLGGAGKTTPPDGPKQKPKPDPDKQPPLPNPEDPAQTPPEFPDPDDGPIPV